jgi:ATP-dependent Clp protease ATP-binding subunit ClpA
MFERFTQPAREVVIAAREEAFRLGHGYTGTEHLLLGVFTTSHGPTARVLAQAGLDSTYVRTEVVRLTGAGSATLGAGEAEALEAIGIDLAAIRSRLEDSFGEGVLDSPAADPGRLAYRSGTRFNRRARKILELALREAKVLRHNYIGTEHILLGLLRDGEGTAAQILASRQPLDLWRQRLLAELHKAA